MQGWLEYDTVFDWPQVHYVILVISSIDHNWARIFQQAGEQNHRDFHWLRTPIDEIPIEHIRIVWEAGEPILEWHKEVISRSSNHGRRSTI